jgi:hypothetical protein
MITFIHCILSSLRTNVLHLDAYVMFLQYDFRIEKPITEWGEETFLPSQLQSISRCEGGATDPLGEVYHRCVNGLLFMIPGTLYSAFDKSAGRVSCYKFPIVKFSGSGDGCFLPASGGLRDAVEGSFQTEYGHMTSWFSRPAT